MNRKFNYSDLPMLVTALTQTDHFEQEKEVFFALNSFGMVPLLKTYQDEV